MARIIKPHHLEALNHLKFGSVGDIIFDEALVDKIGMEELFQLFMYMESHMGVQHVSVVDKDIVDYVTSYNWKEEGCPYKPKGTQSIIVDKDLIVAYYDTSYDNPNKFINLYFEKGKILTHLHSHLGSHEGYVEHWFNPEDSYHQIKQWSYNLHKLRVLCNKPKMFDLDIFEIYPNCRRKHLYNRSEYVLKSLSSAAITQIVTTNPMGIVEWRKDGMLDHNTKAIFVPYTTTINHNKKEEHVLSETRRTVG